MKKLFTVLALTALVPALAFAKADKAKVETFKLDSEASKVVWEGSKIAGKHFGTLKFKSGSLVIKQGKLAGGEFEVDMNSLVVEDIKNPGDNGKLVGHLKSDDFFSTAKHGVSNFKITKVEAEKDGAYKITGDLTIKGIKKSISFPATINRDSGLVKANAKVAVDRTGFDIKYRSGKFFPELGDKVIKDEFSLDLNIVAKK